MESCLLCLEMNKDALDSIKANSTRWQELNVVKVLEKHFWKLNTIQKNSWICLSCWQEVDDFHKFYVRIKEAHMNFGKIKVEDFLETSMKYEDELTIEETEIQNNGEERVKENIAFCFPAQEVRVNQSQSYYMEYGEELTMQETQIKNNKLENDLAIKPTNGESPTTKVSIKTETTSENQAESEIKEEPLDINENNDSYGNGDNDGAYSQLYGDGSEDSNNSNKQRESDKFIAEHFKQMFCDLCQVPLQNFYEVRKHFKEIHNRRGYVVCCMKRFSERNLLVDHLQCHLNPDHFKCSECGRILSNRNNFDRHMLYVHRPNEVVKQHFCDVCGKSFPEAYPLKLHKFTHLPTDKKKFLCNECGKFFASPYLLKLHKQRVHLQKNAKICPICGKSIKKSINYKMHMERHEKSQPFINCDICGYRLTSERGLKVHKETQHPVGGKQDHSCPICLKISPTLDALQKHIKTMHEKSYEHKCRICEKAFQGAEALQEHVASHTAIPLYTYMSLLPKTLSIKLLHACPPQKSSS